MQLIKILIGLFPLIASFANEGLFAHMNREQNLNIIAHFLPYNPSILLIGVSLADIERCKKTWPLAAIATSAEESLLKGQEIDFLWVNGEIPKNKYLMKNLTVLLTNGHYQGADLTLCSRWGYEAFFLKGSLYHGFLKSISFNPETTAYPIGEFSPSQIQKHLKPINSRPPLPGINLVDAIYMISLDQRPEKFEASYKYLKQYGLEPCRFSAINGWNLSIETLNDLGVKLAKPIQNESHMGKVFRKIDGAEYKRIEFITDPDLTYFCTGITRGGIGCLLSHLSILQDALDAGYQTIWVMEDDIYVSEDPRQLTDLILELNQIDPDWDILFTDPDSKDPNGNAVPCRALAMRPDIAIAPMSDFLNKFRPVSDHLFQIGMRYGTYSMILKRSGIEKILAFYKTHALFLPYDCDYWLIPSIRMYAPKKEIVTTATDLSSDNNSPNY